MVTEVPLSCFSSQKFSEDVAKRQVEGVEAGDIIEMINGDTPCHLAERIVTPSDALCACSNGQIAHRVGEMDKFSKTPCVSCDFKRRRDRLGLSVALQMWLKAVKGDRSIVLSIRKASAGDLYQDEDATEEASQRVIVIGGDSSFGKRLPEGLNAALPCRKGPSQPLSKKAKLELDLQEKSLSLQLAKNKLECLQERSRASVQVNDRRLDSDGAAYTLLEFIKQYGGSLNKPPRQWELAPVSGVGLIEKRIDYDEQPYTLQQFILEYGGTLESPPKQWTEARVWIDPDEV